MKFIDLQQQYAHIKAEMDAAVLGVLAHGQYIQGPELIQFEQALAEFVGVEHCIGASSGTTALQIALMALDIRPGEEVITTPFSFFATAEVIYLLGAKPVYVDIDPLTFNIDVTKLKAAVTPRTRAIIPVSLYGQCADMDEINEIAARHGLCVIEDAAQSLGATYKGRQSCGLTKIACTSFHPAKPLGAYGDAGACFTSDPHLAKAMRSIATHGQEGRYNHVMIGINGRCDTLQAAVLLQKLKIFPDELKRRQEVARWYDEALTGDVIKPHIKSHNVSSWAQYTIRVQERETLQQSLKEQGIPTAVHYPKGLHQQPIISQLESQELSFPEAEKAAREVMSLPFHPYLKQSDVKKIAESITSNCVV